MKPTATSRNSPKDPEAYKAAFENRFQNIRAAYEAYQQKKGVAQTKK